MNLIEHHVAEALRIHRERTRWVMIGIFALGVIAGLLIAVGIDIKLAA